MYCYLLFRFITFTGNPHWPELIQALQDSYEPIDRPDIVCKLFMDKMEKFLKDVTQRYVLGKVAGWCYVIEHQKRGDFSKKSFNHILGMPHIHLLLIMDRDFPILTPQQVDDYVSTRIPALPEPSDQSLEAKQQRILWFLVTRFMLHDCNQMCIQESGICRKHFPKDFSDETILSGYFFGF